MAPQQPKVESMSAEEDSPMRKPFRVLGAAIACAAACGLSAAADEIWVAPAEDGNVSVGDWGVTSSGDAHFAFAVPDSLDRFVGAQVMVIGKKNRAITYELGLSISQDGAHHAAFNAGASGLPATIATDKLQALDATALFPPLAAGSDVVALHFRASPQGDVRVVGLRFEFERFPDHAGLACPPHHVLVGFAAETGAPTCIERRLLLEGLLCPPSHFLIGFDPGTGNPRCGDKRVLLAGLQCPAGRFLVGFDALDGSLICKTLSEVTGGGGGGEGILIGISNVEDVEGNVGTRAFTFTVELSAPSASTITVQFTTRNGTATDANDYQEAAGTVTFAPGDVTKPITVLVNGDTTPEDVEVFFVDLASPTGPATIGDSEGLGRIFDDDGGGGRDE
jgi:hypothetical protein